MFTQRVLAAIDAIPTGRVATYRSIACTIGSPRAARAVARACAANPNPPQTPCHRVVRSDGTIGGYSGHGGVATKMYLLAQEGIKIHNGRIVHFEQYVMS